MSRRGLTVAALESLYRERYDHFVRVAAALAGDGEAGRAPVRRWVALGVAALTVVALVAVASPLGAAIAHELGDFSAWLSGQPGSPVSKREQRAFDRANERSWLGFPPGRGCGA